MRSFLSYGIVIASCATLVACLSVTAVSRSTCADNSNADPMSMRWLEKEKAVSNDKGKAAQNSEPPLTQDQIKEYVRLMLKEGKTSEQAEAIVRVMSTEGCTWVEASAKLNGVDKTDPAWINAEARRNTMRDLVKKWKAQNIHLVVGHLGKESSKNGGFIRLNFGHVDRINHLLIKMAEASCQSLGWGADLTATKVTEFDWTNHFSKRHTEMFKRFSRELLSHGMKITERRRLYLIAQAQVVGTEKFPLLVGETPAAGLMTDIMNRLLADLEAEWETRTANDPPPQPPIPDPIPPTVWQTLIEDPFHFLPFPGVRYVLCSDCGSQLPEVDEPAPAPFDIFPAEEELKFSRELGGTSVNGMICP